MVQGPEVGVVVVAGGGLVLVVVVAQGSAVRVLVVRLRPLAWVGCVFAVVLTGWVRLQRVGSQGCAIWQVLVQVRLWLGEAGVKQVSPGSEHDTCRGPRSGCWLQAPPQKQY